jgi:hypothetical protein
MKILVFLALLSASFFSQAATSNELLEHCEQAINMLDQKELRANDRAFAFYCIGYVTGLREMNIGYPLTDFINKNHKWFCEPEGASTAQGIRIIVKYLKEHPEDLHLDMGVGSLTALAQAFPCKV